MNPKESMAIDKKIINITSERQVTIPLKFYEELNFGKEAECFLTNGAIVIRPILNFYNDFTIDILKDLISQGFNGNELLEKFALQHQKVKMAINSLINEADEIADGKRSSVTTDELFGDV